MKSITLLLALFVMSFSNHAKTNHCQVDSILAPTKTIILGRTNQGGGLTVALAEAQLATEAGAYCAETETLQKKLLFLSAPHSR